VEGQIYKVQIGNEELKNKVLKRMREGDDRVGVATNALGWVCTCQMEEWLFI